jgi:hypothetical protein
MKHTLKPAKNYLPEAVLYTIVSLIMFLFLTLNTFGSLAYLFEMLIAGILMIASGVAALVAAGLTLYHAPAQKDRRIAYVCIMVLALAALAYITILSRSSTGQ